MIHINESIDKVLNVGGFDLNRILEKNPEFLAAQMEEEHDHERFVRQQLLDAREISGKVKEL